MENHKFARKRNDTVYIYGLNGEYRVVHYFFIPAERLCMERIASTATYLKGAYPSITHIFAVNNSREIFKAFKELKENSRIENQVDFKLLLEKYGFEIKI